MANNDSIFFFNEDVELRVRSQSELYNLILSFASNLNFYRKGEIIKIQEAQLDIEQLKREIEKKIESRDVNVEEELKKVTFTSDLDALKIKVDYKGKNHVLLSYGKDYELYILLQILKSLENFKPFYYCICSSNGEFRNLRSEFSI